MILLAAALLAAAAPWEVPQRAVPIPGGRHLNLYCTGHGGPTVLLESGFGATTWAWAKVQPLIARTNRVCSYDRAGMGFSPAGPMPRDGTAIVADLNALVKAARLAPPYVLVGHSAGGLTMRLFADAHPGDIAGMVLVDPSLEGQFDGQAADVAARVARYEACAVAAEAHALPSTEPGLRHCSPPLPPALSPGMVAQIAAARLRPGWWRTQASEYAAIGTANSAAVRAGRQSYGDLPLIVLTAGQTAAAAPEWASRHAALAARSTRGVQCTVAGSPHVIMNFAPTVVAAAVTAVARATGPRPPPSPCA